MTDLFKHTLNNKDITIWLNEKKTTTIFLIQSVYLAKGPYLYRRFSKTISAKTKNVSYTGFEKKCILCSI